MSVVVARVPVGTDQTVTYFAPASFPLAIVGFHDAVAHNFLYRIVLGWPDGLTIYAPPLTDDQSEFMRWQRYRDGAFIGVITVVLTFTVLVLCEVIQFLWIRHGPRPKSPKSPVRVRVMKTTRLPLPAFTRRLRPILLTGGLILLLGGGFLVFVPLQVSTSSDRVYFEMGNSHPPHLGIGRGFTVGQTVEVLVQFDAAASVGTRRVWFGIEAGLPQHHQQLIIWSVVNQSRVTFTFSSWAIPFPAILIQGLHIAVSYEGTNYVTGNVTILTSTSGFAALGGLLFLLSSFPLWSFIIITVLLLREEQQELPDDLITSENRRS
ncbi:MAG: hypothetical protein ACFE8F_12025 [Promethearchaeota archaeon]